MSEDCPNCAFWKAERDKAVAHATEYGPKLSDAAVRMAALSEELMEALDMATQLIQEAKGQAGDGLITDHLDAAEMWLRKVEAISPCFDDLKIA